METINEYWNYIYTFRSGYYFIEQFYFSDVGKYVCSIDYYSPDGNIIEAESDNGEYTKLNNVIKLNGSGMDMFMTSDLSFKVPDKIDDILKIFNIIKIIEINEKTIKIQFYKEELLEEKEYIISKPLTFEKYSFTEISNNITLKDKFTRLNELYKSSLEPINKMDNEEVDQLLRAINNEDEDENNTMNIQKKEILQFANRIYNDVKKINKSFKTLEVIDVKEDLLAIVALFDYNIVEDKNNLNLQASIDKEGFSFMFFDINRNFNKNLIPILMEIIPELNTQYEFKDYGCESHYSYKKEFNFNQYDEFINDFCKIVLLFNKYMEKGKKNTGCTAHNKR